MPGLKDSRRWPFGNTKDMLYKGGMPRREKNCTLLPINCLLLLRIFSTRKRLGF